MYVVYWSLHLTMCILYSDVSKEDNNLVFSLPSTSNSRPLPERLAFLLCSPFLGFVPPAVAFHNVYAWAVDYSEQLITLRAWVFLQNSLTVGFSFTLPCCHCKPKYFSSRSWEISKLNCQEVGEISCQQESFCHWIAENLGRNMKGHVDEQQLPQSTSN